MVDLTLCISLDRRPDRWQQFTNSISDLRDIARQMCSVYDHGSEKSVMDCYWPFPRVKRISAVDGMTIGSVPHIWRQGEDTRTLGMYGCYLSHIKCLEYILESRSKSALVLEDDAVFDPMFGTRAMAFINHVNTIHGWHVIYLGGEHIQDPIFVGATVADLRVVRPQQVRRTHAYAVNGRHMIQRLVDFLWSNQGLGVEVDIMLWRFIEEYRLKCYCPSPWLVGQRGGVQSDIQVEQADGGAVVHQQDMWW